jgi:hypothetical protein
MLGKIQWEIVNLNRILWVRNSQTTLLGKLSRNPVKKRMPRPYDPYRRSIPST